MAKPSVPQFGNWESGESVPYTVYFEKARKNKGGKIINPNDPEENADIYPEARPEEPVKRVAPKTGRSSVVNESSNQGYGGGSASRGKARPSRPPSVGSEYSIDRSPLHPSQQSRLTGKGNGSPAYDGKKSYDSSHGTATRLKPKTGDNSRDVAIPKFGDWDVGDPQSADNYTYIFNKNARGANPADEDSVPSHNSHHTKNGDADAKSSGKCCFCFPWPWAKK